MDLKSLFKSVIGFHDEIVSSHDKREPEVVGKLAYYGKPWIDLADAAKHATAKDAINALIPDPVSGLHASAQALARHEYGKAFALGMGSTPFGSIGMLPAEQLAQLRQYAARGEIPPSSVLQHPNEPQIGTTYHGTSYSNAQGLDAARKPDLGRAGEIWGDSFPDGGLHGKAFYTDTNPEHAFEWGNRAGHQYDEYAAPVVFKAKFPTNTVIHEKDLASALHARLQAGHSIDLPGSGSQEYNSKYHSSSGHGVVLPGMVANPSELLDLIDPADLPSLAQKYFGAKGLSVYYQKQGHVVFPDVTDVRVKPMFKGDPQIEDPGHFMEESGERISRMSDIFDKPVNDSPLVKTMRKRAGALNMTYNVK